jgi:hypothetical protein
VIYGVERSRRWTDEYGTRFLSWCLLSHSYVPAALRHKPPQVTSLSPTTGAVGTAVTITGTNFGATQGSSTVTFNGTPAVPTSWSVTQIVAPVPTGATTGNIVVTVGGVASNGVAFTVVTTPLISGTNPALGGVGATVTITGSNFGATQVSSTISLNGITLTPSSWSDLAITFVVPASATTGP